MKNPKRKELETLKTKDIKRHVRICNDILQLQGGDKRKGKTTRELRTKLISILNDRQNKN